jgi:Ca2+-binding RTX toxin-like protein
VSLALTTAQNTVGAGTDTLTAIASLQGSSFHDVLTGNSAYNTLDGGAGNDTLSGGAGNDTYFVDSVSDRVYETTTTSSSNTIDAGGTDRIFSTVSLSLDAYNGVRFVEKLTLQGSGNINGTGNSLNNTITGNSGNNTLNGGTGNDTLEGAAGNDMLIGGAGNDVLTGGIGADAFVFNFAPNVTTNLDTITDFNVVDDTIQLENSIFTALGLTTGTLSAANFVIGTAAADATDRIIYNSTTGALLYDSNGNVAGGSVQIATLATGLAMTNNDFLII